ncbi:MAG: MFS transporter [Clostridiales bacterium]|nr:MFS transporter [Clostridiales bacterium]
MPAYKWRIFSVTGLASITTATAVSSISLALPVIAEEFGVTMSAISWLSLIYSLIQSCTLLIFGRLADLYGYKRQFIGGFLVFGMASALLPILARGLLGLVFFRCLQGLGGAMMISITQAMCNRVFPPNERGKALGVNSVFVSVGYAIGPSISGILMSSFSWRSIFYFNLPSCILGLIMAFLILRKDEVDPSAERKMDVPGSLLFALAVGTLAVAINFSAEWGFGSALFLGCLLVSCVSLGAFIYWERHTDAPLMKLALYSNPVFSFANGASVCSYALQQMTSFLVPFFLINILFLSKSDSGFIMLAMPLTMMLFSPYGGRLTDRHGSRLPALAGLAILAIGCIGMCFLTEATPVAVVVAALLLYGAGNGLSVQAVNAAIFSAVPREHSGMASGMVATLRNLGQGMGVAFGGAIMAVRQQYYASGRGLSGGAVGGSGALGESGIYLTAQRDAFLFGLFVVCIALFCMYRIPGKTEQEE